MRVVVCDYSGHPFQVQLARELARRGHSALHLSFAEFQTPKGRLSVEPGDPATFSLDTVSLGRPFAKHTFIKRRSEEIEVGRRIAARIVGFAPDAVIGSNLPLDTLGQVLAGAKREGAAFVFWQQDIYSIAIQKILSGKFGAPGGLVGQYYRHLERRALAASDAVVVISEDFVAEIRDGFGLPQTEVHVVENWAPLDEIVPRPRDNAWAAAQSLGDAEVVLYTGTLGMKHDPAQLLAIAHALEDRSKAKMIVTSEGPAAEWLAREGANLSSLRVLPFQPYAVYSDVLASAHVLVSVLEADAGAYSVPSKVLSYLCAGRAIVLSAPPENLAVRLVASAAAGLTTRPSDHSAVRTAVTALLDDPEKRKACGANARAYAERAFDIRAIGDKFENILRGVLVPEAPAYRALGVQPTA